MSCGAGLQPPGSGAAGARGSGAHSPTGGLDATRAGRAVATCRGARPAPGVQPASPPATHGKQGPHDQLLPLVSSRQLHCRHLQVNGSDQCRTEGSPRSSRLVTGPDTHHRLLPAARWTQTHSAVSWWPEGAIALGNAAGAPEPTRALLSLWRRGSRRSRWRGPHSVCKSPHGRRGRKQGTRKGGARAPGRGLDGLVLHVLRTVGRRPPQGQGHPAAPAPVPCAQPPPALGPCPAPRRRRAGGTEQPLRPG